MSRKTDKLEEKKGKEKDPLCPRCRRRMNYIETDVGEFRLWCYYCEAPLITGQNINLFEPD